MKPLSRCCRPSEELLLRKAYSLAPLPLDVGIALWDATSFGSCSSLAFSRFLPRILRASFEGGLSVIALFRPSAARERCCRSGEDALGRHQQTAGAPVHPKSRIESCLDGPPRSSVRAQPTLVVVGQASHAMDVADPAGLSSLSSFGLRAFAVALRLLP